MRNIATAIFIILCCGCSNQGMYEAIQQSQKNDCAKLPLSQYEECMREVDVSYDEYERDRQELLETDKS